MLDIYLDEGLKPLRGRWDGENFKLISIGDVVMGTGVSVRMTVAPVLIEAVFERMLEPGALGLGIGNLIIFWAGNPKVNELRKMFGMRCVNEAPMSIISGSGTVLESKCEGQTGWVPP